MRDTITLRVLDKKVNDTIYANFNDGESAENKGLLSLVQSSTHPSNTDEVVIDKKQAKNLIPVLRDYINEGSE